MMLTLLTVTPVRYAKCHLLAVLFDSSLDLKSYLSPHFRDFDLNDECLHLYVNCHLRTRIDVWL